MTALARLARAHRGRTVHAVMRAPGLGVGWWASRCVRVDRRGHARARVVGLVMDWCPMMPDADYPMCRRCARLLADDDD